MRLFYLPLLAYFSLSSPSLLAHGGVAFEEDNCVLNIGFLKAHFTGYQPKSRGNSEFCEDIPDVGESVFVVEYLHGFLNQIPVDFRIIEDIEGFGVFANWEDIESIKDLEHVTVFYQPPMRRPSGVMTVEYEFRNAGSYIGIVTAPHPKQDKIYRAVFQFQVGGRPYSYFFIFGVFIVLAQLVYWINTGGLRKFRQRRLP